MIRGKSRGARRLVLGLACAALVLLPAASLAVYEVPIYQPGLTKLQIGLPDFKDLSGGHADLGAKMRDLLADDLMLSGYFQVIDKKLYVEKPGAGLTVGTFDFADWRVLRADALVKAGFALDGDALTLELRYFDVFGGKQTLGKRYAGKPDEWNTMIHRFGNEIMLLLTGEPGIFGTRVAFVSDRSGAKEIYTIGINGDGQAKLTANGTINLTPHWSPDGAQLAFTSYMARKPDLYRMPSGGGKATVLSARPSLNLGGRWDPDGRVLTVTLHETGESELFLIGNDGKIVRQLTRGQGIAVSASWSPDGSRIAFVSDRSGNPQVYVMGRDGGDVRRLTYQGSYNVSPAWSPKGDKILFQGLEGGTYQIYMTTPDGSQVFRVSDGVGSNEDPSWSPDGRSIVYASNRTGRRNLYVMNLDGSYTKQLTSGRWNDTSPDWSPRLLK